MLTEINGTSKLRKEMLTETMIIHNSEKDLPVQFSGQTGWKHVCAKGIPQKHTLL
jgi:hypothetical protein